MKWYLAEATFKEIVDNKLKDGYKYLIHYATKQDPVEETRGLINGILNNDISIVGDPAIKITGPYESFEASKESTDKVENPNISLGES